MATLNTVRDTLVFHLRQGKDHNQTRKAAIEYLLHGRKLDWRVIMCSPIGVVPHNWDIADAIAAGQKALAFESKIWENEPEDSKQKAKLKADFDQQKALFDQLNKDLELHRHHVGWLAFAYENQDGDCIAINFRKIGKSEGGRNIVRLLKPLECKGVFNPQISGDCLSHDGRVLVMEGEFNQLRFLSECAREADRRGDNWEQWLESSVTMGSATGQDVYTLKQVLLNKGAAFDIPVIMHDNDTAGESAATSIVRAMSAHVFTTTDPKYSDLDEMFDAIPPTKVLGWLQKRVGDAPLRYRPIDAVREELDVIRLNPDKLKPFIVEREVIITVANDLKERATYIVDAWPYAWLPETKRLIQVKKDSQPFYALLEEYGLHREQKIQSMVAAKLEAEVARGQRAQVHKLFFSAEDASYLNGGKNRIIKITTESIEYVENGTDDVYFAEDSKLKVPELSDKWLGLITPYGVKLNRSPLCTYFSAVKWDERAMSGPRMPQLFMSRVIAMFLFYHIRMWPILIATGEQDSGKASLLENIGRLFYGPDYRVAGLPGRYQDIIPKMTNSELCFFNNTDNVDLEEMGVLNLFCNAVYGEGDETARQLFKDNVELNYRMLANVGLTARNMNFNRSDAMRRSLVFALQKPPKDLVKDKVERREEFLENHAELFHELLLRVQQTRVALKATEGKRYTRVSDMDEYERYTLRVADYEGWLPECQEIWQAFQADYKRDIIMGDPLVMILRLWLGKRDGGNVGREVSTSTLWGECEEIREKFGLKQTYASADSLGRKLCRGDAATMLETLGHRRTGVSRPMHSFHPKLEVKLACIQEFNDLSKAKQPWLDAMGSIEASDAAIKAVN